MAEIVVEAIERNDSGKNSNRRLRAQGMIPAVVYGQKTDSLPLRVNPDDLDRILHSETGRNTIFKLSVGKTSKDVLIKDYQLDPIGGGLLHADFQVVAMDQTMTFAVPVQPVGKSVGVTAGGVLDLVLREIEVECLPTEVPEHINVEIDELDVGDSLRVKDLKIESSKVVILSNADLVVLTVVPPHVEEEVVEEIEELEEGAEPELIGEDKEETEGAKDRKGTPPKQE